MIDDATIKTIYDQTRAFFKGTLKSSNKRYDKWFWQSHTEAETKRNTNCPLASTQLAADRTSFSGKTPLQIGELIWKKGQPGGSENIAGNCGEMACVAAYIAVSKHGASPNDLELNTTRYTEKGGTIGHDFLMVEGQGRRWVIDPWLATCCPLAEYADAVTKKLAEWSEQNKRLLVPGRGWVDAKSSSITGLLGAKSKWAQRGVEQVGQVDNT